MDSVEPDSEREVSLGATKDGCDRASYERAILEIREKERELTKRTEMLENMMRALSINLSSEPISPRSNEATNYAQGRNSVTSPLTGITSPGFPAPYPKSCLRDALELVPKYDGHNISVWQFARACKRARDSLPGVDEASSYVAK